MEQLLSYRLSLVRSRVVHDVGGPNVSNRHADGIGAAGGGGKDHDQGPDGGTIVRRGTQQPHATKCTHDTRPR